MSEFPKVCKFSSTQAISPQYLNVLTSNLVQRFVRGLGIFACTALLKISASPKNYTLFVTFLQIVKTFCDAAHSYFNIQQFSILGCLSDGMVQVFDRNLAPTSVLCNYLLPQNASLVQGLH